MREKSMIPQGHREELVREVSYPMGGGSAFGRRVVEHKRLVPVNAQVAASSSAQVQK